MKAWYDGHKWHRGPAPSDATEGLSGKVRGQIKGHWGDWWYRGLLSEWQRAKSRREAKRRVEEIDRSLTDPKCASPY